MQSKEQQTSKGGLDPRFTGNFQLYSRDQNGAGLSGYMKCKSCKSSDLQRPKPTRILLRSQNSIFLGITASISMK